MELQLIMSMIKVKVNFTSQIYSDALTTVTLHRESLMKLGMNKN